MHGGSDDDQAGSGSSMHDVYRGRDLVRQGIALIAQARTWSLADAELRGAVADGAGLLAAVESAWLGLVAALDGRPTAVAGARPGRTAATFLTLGLNRSPAQAGRDIAAAHALHDETPRLPQLAAAFAAGEVSRGHVDVAVRTLARVPDHLGQRVDADGQSGWARVDSYLAQESRRFAPSNTDRLAKQLLHVLDPEGTDRYDPNAFMRRQLSCAQDSTGMTVGTFQLDAAGGAAVRAALDLYSAPSPAGNGGVDADGQPVLFRDDRTKAQRMADGMVAIARVALAAHPQHDDADRATPADGAKGEQVKWRGAPAAHVLIVATPEQLAAARAAIPAPRTGDGDESSAPPWLTGREDRSAAGLADCRQLGPVDPGTLGLLACDAIWQLVVMSPAGVPLDLGRAVRTVTTAQRRALIARDRGCIIPGCAAPVGICDAHHVTWWRHGGPTDLANLALVCPGHHAAIHAGIWHLTVIHALPWAIPPRWKDPQQRPLRNTLHDAEDQARRLGQQLRLHFDQPPNRSSPDRPASDKPSADREDDPDP